MTDLIVRELETDKEVERIKLSNTNERHVERVMSGMLRNMNTDKYYIDDSEVEENT